MAANTPYKRDSPFLQRTLKSVMGMAGIKLAPATGDAPIRNGDLTPRPAKRRRVTGDSSESPPFAFANHLAQSPSTAAFERALRIEVLRIGRSDIPLLSPGEMPDGHVAMGDPPIIRARCRITIMKIVDQSEKRVLFCDSQPCTVTILRDCDNICRRARIRQLQPFHIPEEKLHVECDGNQGFGLYERYVIAADIESAGDRSWPPMHLLRDEEAARDELAPPRQWVFMSAAYSRLDEKGRISSSMKIRKGRNPRHTDTGLSMDVDLKWSTFGGFGTTQRPVDELTPPEDSRPVLNGPLEPLTNGHVNGRVENFVNGHAKEDIEIFAGAEEDLEGDINTPSRSLRAREKQQNYNLKALSDLAVGKENRERKKAKAAAERALETGQVTWILPTGPPLSLPHWTCATCYVAHNSMDQLRRHVMEHQHDLKYTVFDASLRAGVKIVISRPDQATPRSVRTIEQLEPPSEDEGDDTEASPTPEKSQSPPRPSLVQPRPAPRKPPQERKQIVPDIKQAMFDRLSKTRLEPKSQVDEPLVDNTWLLQKHRDNIRDYSDLDAEEKEFIHEFDAYAHREKLVMGPHMPQVYLGFLGEKSAWLAASQHRMQEAMKHLAYLKGRGALKEDALNEAFKILRLARFHARNDPGEAPKPPSPPRTDYRPSVSGCATCRQPVWGPSTLICSNLDCDMPLYHIDCIRDTARIPVEEADWRCDDCAK